ncbi:flagellar export chaperone FliS [Clostridium sp. BL-8]|uniref:flagellar export chaperone FliS n=1 Tax=Clostridium sp. BL-8 TaxID=349938 RepID=UPI00098BD424|nr:flagellar export chaperone FliS [Clostridium sp. BL-8]OOM79980.1 flagellar protein FliS [Clostridium sp. BL-8]
MYSNGYNIYKNNSVTYASKEQLLLMLVDGAVKFAKISRQAIVDKDIKKAHDYLIKTQDIFIELMVTLDVSKAEWLSNLFEVYRYIKDKLVEINLKKDLGILDEIIPLIESVRQLWSDCYKEAKKH